MTSLLKSYTKLALRHSWKHKWPVIINVFGLGMALSLCVFLYMIYAYNFEFDKFFGSSTEIYRVHSFNRSNDIMHRNEVMPLAMDHAVRNEISGINQVSSYLSKKVTVKNGTEYFTEYAGVISNDFPQMFNIPLKYGTWADLGKQPSAYFTEELATKYFGTEFPIGEELTLYFHEDQKITVSVAGIIKKVPLNTSFDSELFISLDDYLEGVYATKSDWVSNRYAGYYIKVNTGNEETIEDELNKHLPLQNKYHETFQLEKFELVPFLSPLVSDELMSTKFTNSRLRPQILIIFTVLIAMVFLTACFNLANTSIALISNRIKEIGIRKTLGSNNTQILIQFLFEMVIICALAFVIAISTANMTSTAIMGLFSAKFLLQDVDLTNVIIFILIFLLITTLVAGLLPGLYAWKFQPVEIMRKSIKLKGVNWLNKTLIAVQYVFSIAVLIAGITFSRNSEFLDNMDIGYQVDGIVDLVIENENYPILKQKIEQIPGVVVAGSDSHFGRGGRHTLDITLKLESKEHTVKYYAVGDNYLDLMELDILAGRNFNSGSKADHGSVLVNQSFVDQFLSNVDPINHVLKINGERRTVVGITSNILEDVYEDAILEPSIIGLAKESSFRHMVVRTTGDVNELNSELRSIWSQYIDRPYTGRFQEDVALGTAGRDSKNLQTIFLSVALLSGFLSIVGIFSLAKLNITKRIKEITIRKVLGATIKELLFSINRSFAWMLMIALVFGCGLGYLISEGVLSLIYKYYVDVSIFSSLACGLGVEVLSIIILSGVALELANSNPVNGLRED